MNKLVIFLLALAIFSVGKSAHAREYNAKCPNGSFVKEIIAKNRDHRLGIRCYKVGGISTSTDDGRFWTRYFARNVMSNRSYSTASCPPSSFISEVIYSDVKDHWGIRCREISVQNQPAFQSGDFWTRPFLNTRTNQSNWATCNSTGIGAEIVFDQGNLSLRCRQALINNQALIFNDGYWTRYFAEGNN